MQKSVQDKRRFSEAIFRGDFTIEPLWLVFWNHHRTLFLRLYRLLRLQISCVFAVWTWTVSRVYVSRWNNVIITNADQITHQEYNCFSGSAWDWRMFNSTCIRKTWSPPPCDTLSAYISTVLGLATTNMLGSIGLSYIGRLSSVTFSALRVRAWAAIT